MTMLARFEQLTDGIADHLRRPPVYVACIFLVQVALLTRWMPADLDIFARVAVGRLVEIHGAVAATDPFAYTPTLERWIDHEWLSGVIFYHLSQWGGDRLLFGFKVALMLASLVLLAAAQASNTRRRGAIFPWLLLTIISTAYVWTANVRSQVFTFTFLPLLLLAIVRYRRARDWRLLAIMPLVMLLWANLHGGFVVGLGFLSIFAVACTLESRRFAAPVWLVLGGCVLATLVNPYGIDYWPYVVSAITMPRPRILEWRPVPWNSPHALKLATFAGLLAWGHFRRGRRIPLEGLLMTAAALFFAFRSVRLVAFFMMVATVYGTDAFAAFLDWLRARLGTHYLAIRRVLGLYSVAGVLALLVIVGGLVAGFPHFRLDYSHLPVDAVEWLRTHRPGGKLLVHFNHGSFALWRLYPDFRVSLDGRYEEVYPPATVENVYTALDPSDPDHREALRKVWPDYILLWTDSEAFERRREFGPQWSVIYQNPDFAVLGRGAESEFPTRRPVDRRPMWEPGF